LQDFSLNSSKEEKQDFFAYTPETIKTLKINEGYRAITNIVINANQEVPYFHMHILAGQPLGKMLCK
jgi:histidine triad (HIT) family protein